MYTFFELNNINKNEKKTIKDLCIKAIILLRSGFLINSINVSFFKFHSFFKIFFFKEFSLAEIVIVTLVTVYVCGMCEITSWVTWLCLLQQTLPCIIGISKRIVYCPVSLGFPDNSWLIISYIFINTPNHLHC